MLKVNFKDGTTLAFDLNSEDDVQQWREWVSAKEFQGNITGIGIIHNKKYHAFPCPQNFKSIRIDADLIFNDKDGIKRQAAERITCIADDTKVQMVVYTYENPPPPIAMKVDVTKMKRRRWEPEYKEANS